MAVFQVGQAQAQLAPDRLTSLILTMRSLRRVRMLNLRNLLIFLPLRVGSRSLLNPDFHVGLVDLELGSSLTGHQQRRQLPSLDSAPQRISTHAGNVGRFFQS